MQLVYNRVLLTVVFIAVIFSSAYAGGSKSQHLNKEEASPVTQILSSKVLPNERITNNKLPPPLHSRKIERKFKRITEEIQNEQDQLIKQRDKRKEKVISQIKKFPYGYHGRERLIKHNENRIKHRALSNWQISASKILQSKAKEIEKGSLIDQVHQYIPKNHLTQKIIPQEDTEMHRSGKASKMNKVGHDLMQKAILNKQISQNENQMRLNVAGNLKGFSERQKLVQMKRESDLRFKEDLKIHQATKPLKDFEQDNKAYFDLKMFQRQKSIR